MNHDAPHLHKHKQRNVRKFVQWQQEWEEVVWYTLTESVDRVEGMRRKGCWHDPLVMRFVQSPVEELAVQAPMDPVDAEVGEKDEDRELEPVPMLAKQGEYRMRELADMVVNVGVASNFDDEDGNGETSHYGNRTQSLRDLHLDLVLEVFRVVEGGFVEDKSVG
jgi:hypothetical protein